jgi:LmbE family N-acetylglucosaminyl deacetylase
LVNASRVIEGEGTPEEAWEGWDIPLHVPSVSFGDLVAPDERLVVIAPHPDDEILGTAGLLRAAHAAGRAVALLAVTDGEASHPGSTLYRPEQLALVRQQESEAALRTLGLAVEAMRFGLPDGKVSAHEVELVGLVAGLIRRGDVVVTTWELDGHPDHEATGRAVRAAAVLVGVRCLAAPIWTWHWSDVGDARVPWDRAVRLDLSPEDADAKADALLQHRSQLEADPTTGRGPILPPWARARLLRNFEVFFR